MRSKKTRRAIRQLAREATNRGKQPDAPPSPPRGTPALPVQDSSVIPTAELVKEQSSGGTSVIPTAELISEDGGPGRPVPLSQAETAALPSIPRSAENDPSAETEGDTDPPASTDAPQEPPAKIPFSCPCGAFLTASRQLYDKRMRCSSCGEILLLTLLYKADLQRFEIYPLRATPEP